jgi:hypothetical protein
VGISGGAMGTSPVDGNPLDIRFGNLASTGDDERFGDLSHL